MAGDFKFLEPVMNTFVSGNFAAHYPTMSGSYMKESIID